MKKRFLLISIMICLVIGMQAVISASDDIMVSLSNYNIYYHNAITTINKNLQYPLLSCNNITYISVRDIASVLKRPVVWDEDEKAIYLQATKGDYEVIKKPETALAIGKAIIEEHYPDRVGKNSVYWSGYIEMVDWHKENYYEVAVLFDPPEDKIIDNDYIMDHREVKVLISLKDGSFTMSERGLDRQWKQVSTESPSESPSTGNVPSTAIYRSEE